MKLQEDYAYSYYEVKDLIKDSYEPEGINSKGQRIEYIDGGKYVDGKEVLYDKLGNIKQLTTKIENRKDLDKSFANSPFSINPVLARQYRKLPLLLFIVLSFVVPAIGGAILLFYPNPIPDFLNKVAVITFPFGIVAFIISGIYLMIEHGRSSNIHWLEIHPNGLSYGRLRKTTKPNSVLYENKADVYVYTHIYKYKIKKRKILIWGDGRFTRLTIARMFTNEHILIDFLENFSEKK